MKNAVVVALFTALIVIFSLLGYAIFVQLSSGEIGAEAGKYLCLALVFLPVFFAFELLFKRYYYLREERESED